MKCQICKVEIEKVVETFSTYYTSIEDGDSLSYSPTLHDHKPKRERVTPPVVVELPLFNQLMRDTFGGLGDR